MYNWMDSIYNKYTLARGLVDGTVGLIKGAGNLVTVAQARTYAVAKFVDQLCYITAWWVPMIAACYYSQAILPWPLDSAAWLGENVSCWMFVLELTVVSLSLQRSLKCALRPVCRAEFTGTNLKTIVSQWTTPVLISALGSRVPCVWLATMARGWALGCQIHDGALSARGICNSHRAWSWDREALVYIVIGIAIDVQARHWAPAFLVIPLVYLLSFAVTLVATFRPTGAMPDHSNVPAPAHRCLHLPYGMAFQLVERLRRATAGGAFAPSLERRTPLATTILRIYTVFSHPMVQFVLPSDLARPELGFIMGDLVRPKHLAQALKMCGALVAASESNMQRNITIYLPALAKLMTGLPQHVIAIIKQILADPRNISIVHALRRDLAQRYSNLQERERVIMTAADWRALFVSEAQAIEWGLVINGLLVDAADHEWVTVQLEPAAPPTVEPSMSSSEVHRLMMEALASSEL